MLGISNLDQIINTPINTAPITGIFGRELPHTWCYYFEKADLSSQFGDWQEVIRLYDPANSQGYAPKDGSEWTPFMRALPKLKLGPGSAAHQ